MKRVRLHHVLFACGIICLAGSVLTYPNQSALRSLEGGASCKACCAASSKLFYECDHTSMDPNVQTCSTSDCLVNIHYYVACPTGGTASCNWMFSTVALGGYQEWRDGAPAACTTVNQDPVIVVPLTECQRPPAEGRCLINSCGGNLLQTPDYRYGSMVCTG